MADRRKAFYEYHGPLLLPFYIASPTSNTQSRTSSWKTKYIVGLESRHLGHTSPYGVSRISKEQVVSSQSNFTPRSIIFKMAKRSREDFEPSSPDSEATGESPVTAFSVIHPRSVEQSSTTSKIIQLDPESGEASPVAEMRCSLPPHRTTLSFQSFDEYEVHYQKEHTNRCLECRKNFPTTHFLSLHIEENHDSLISVRRERGEKTVSFQCQTRTLTLT